MAQLNDLLVMGQSTLLGPVTVNNQLTLNAQLTANASIFTSRSLNITNGSDLILRGSATGAASDTGDIIFADANGTENARLWWDQSAKQLYHRITATGSACKIYHTGNLSFVLSTTNSTNDTLTITF